MWVEPGAAARLKHVLHRTVSAGGCMSALHDLLFNHDRSIVLSACGLNRHRPNIMLNLAHFQKTTAQLMQDRQAASACANLYRMGTKASQQKFTKKEKKLRREAAEREKKGGAKKGGRPQGGGAAGAAAPPAPPPPPPTPRATSAAEIDPDLGAHRLTCKQFQQALAAPAAAMWDSVNRANVPCASFFVGTPGGGDDCGAHSVPARNNVRGLALPPRMSVADFVARCPPATFERPHTACQPLASLARPVIVVVQSYAEADMLVEHVRAQQSARKGGGGGGGASGGGCGSDSAV